MDRNHPLELPRKALFDPRRPHYHGYPFDHGTPPYHGYQFDHGTPPYHDYPFDHRRPHHGYPPNFKRQIFEATTQFMRRWRPSFSPPVRKAVGALSPLGTKDSVWRFNKPVSRSSRSKRGSLKPTVTNVRRRPSAESGKGRWHKIGTLPRQSLGQGSREILPEPVSSSKKYQPPRIQNDVCVVHRDVACDISPHYGGEASFDPPFQDNMAAHSRSVMEQQPLVETVCKLDKMSKDETEEECAAPRVIHGLGIGCGGRADCVSFSKYEVEINGRLHLEQWTPGEMVWEFDNKLENDQDGDAYERKLGRTHSKEVARQVYSGPECGKFIAKDTHRPFEHELKVIGEAMETELENCSTELSGDDECVLTSELHGKTNSDHDMTEATCGPIGSQSKFAGAVVSDPSPVMQNKIEFLELNALENKSPSPTTKPMESSESSLFGLDKIEVFEPNSPSKKAMEVSEALSLTAKAMDAVYRESGNYLLAKESNNRSVVPYLVDLNRIKVCKALNLFDDIYQKLLQQLEEKPKAERKKAGQIPVEAARIAKQELTWFNTNERVVGAIPGIEVGDQFCFRAQLVLIGLHCHYTSGIDYMKKDGKIFATSIVDSGHHTHEKASDLYTSESESPYVFTFSGQGGNPRVDHRLEGGNLALKNSMETRTPVRVFRKLQTDQTIRPSAKSGKIASLLYDGLYVVSNCAQERGPHGKLIFKFQFTRITGQPELAKTLVSTANKLKVHGDCNVVDDDISQGKEKIPIRALNSLDDEKPPRFKYVTEMVYPNNLDKSTSSSGCDCINGCSDLEPCSCLIKNGGEIPFNENGSILRAKSIIYECGPSCKCPPSCKNRVSQHGVQYPLEIFKTKSKGWGVWSQDFISQGSFICEYAGELLSETEAEKRKDKDEYLFDIGNNYDNHAAPKTTAHHQQARNSKKRNDNCDFTVDAAEYGNVGRFLNHSCSPNVFAQDVLYDHDDKRRSHIMLFASKSIPPLRELTFDYNYKIDQVCDANGNIKKKNCYCGARSCNGRMY